MKIVEKKKSVGGGWKKGFLYLSVIQGIRIRGRPKGTHITGKDYIAQRTPSIMDLIHSSLGKEKILNNNKHVCIPT